MTKVLLALALQSSAAAVPVVNVEHIFMFRFDDWAFDCRAHSDRLSDCKAQKSFGDISVQLREEGDGVAVSVDGGCAAGGAGTVDLVDEVRRGQRYAVDPQRVRSVAADRVNARRAACGQSSLPGDEAESLEAASILFVEMTD